ncbi:MAG: acetyl-CoA carboxylase biotin carboxyl carrier protein subunit [Candidatus Cloacimonetes bacterium]|jgi:biotin carboxyl carrier protein|nr:acetyl-CoA carboxylase biotin carboxyl carrier protein subunit [Candidatus Cloacimonadota bacterium]MDD4155586.1 acetyl-CoA carboxylase biotin carboxyl carrier protein subunit [Candidatus Cloacimonadota bacterium]
MSDIKIDLTKKQTKTFEVYVDNEKFNVEVVLPEGFKIDEKMLNSKPKDEKTIPPIVHLPNPEPQFPQGEHGILAPMPGNIISYEKKIGEKVKTGDTVLVLEAMKMYNNLCAPCDGVIKSIPFKPGDNVKKYDTLCIVEA